MITRNLLTRSYKLLLTLLVLLMSTNAFAQRLTATGKVVDAAGLEVIGASVLEKGTTNGVVTNLDGEFSLSVGQNATLVISFIGYKTIEVKAATNMNITLQEDNELLDEVVVIGYGSVKRKDVTTPYLRFLQRIWTNAPLYRQPKPYKVKQPVCRLCSPAANRAVV